MKQKRNYQTVHRIEDTRSQVQYTRHQSLRTLIKIDIYHKEKKETLYHLLFECERFRAIREDYPILNKSVKKVFKALENDDHQLMDYLNTAFSLLNIKNNKKCNKKYNI